MQFSNVGIVYNGGKPHHAHTVVRLARALSPGAVVVRATTPSPGSATRLARDLSLKGADLVISVGGDGTACQVAEGLLDSTTVMSVYPGGTGNLFARAFLGLPSPEEFAAMLASGEPQPIDIIEIDYTTSSGSTGRQYSLVGTGIGRISDAISETSPMLKRFFGRLIYAARVSMAALDPRPLRLRIETRGKAVIETASGLFVLNVIPPVMTALSRGCNASDGLMDVCAVTATNFWQMLKVAVCLAFGRPDRSRRYRSMRVAEMSFSASRPVSLNIDGDASPLVANARFRVLPGAVRMLMSF